MRLGYIKDVDAYIDQSIEDIQLREIDWHITLCLFMDELPDVLRAKWRRAAYLQSGL